MAPVLLSIPLWLQPLEWEDGEYVKRVAQKGGSCGHGSNFEAETACTNGMHAKCCTPVMCVQRRH